MSHFGKAGTRALVLRVTTEVTAHKRRHAADGGHVTSNHGKTESGGEGKGYVGGWLGRVS